MLKLDAVTKTYRQSGNEIHALQSVNLKLDDGQFVAIRGPSGCGKSTLLLTAGGLLRPDHGSVEIDGTSLYHVSSAERAAVRQAKIGFVFQQFHLIPYLNVLDNVLSATIGTKSQLAEKKDRAERLLKQFSMSHRRMHRPGQLSTGEKQRVAMARAMLNQPSLILADEPTGNLDKENADVILQQLRALSNDGVTVVLVTHDDHASAAADDVIRMEAGSLMLE
ncbi:MAG: ABC transporter ATP-binding protein [Pirellulaceae bacterium]